MQLISSSIVLQYQHPLQQEFVNFMFNVKYRQKIFIRKHSKTSNPTN